MNATSSLAQLFGVTPAAWALVAVALSVGLLTLLIAWAKVQPLLAFVVASLAAALLLGMPLARIPSSIEKGIGDLLVSELKCGFRRRLDPRLLPDRRSARDRY